MNILICGYTASGKSSIVEYIAKKLKYKFVHTSHILKQIHNNKPINQKNTKMNKGWYEFSGLDNVRKDDISLDKKLDHYLVQLVKNKNNLVLDSWTLPYLTKKKGFIKIWLKATKKERVRRLTKRDKISLKEANKILKQKDGFQRKQFIKLYDFDLNDLSVYDFIYDTTKHSLKANCENVYKLVKEKLK